MSKDHPNHSFARQEIRENWGKFSLALSLAYEEGRRALQAAKAEIAVLPGWRDFPQKCLDEYVEARRHEAVEAKYREVCALVQVPEPSKLCYYVDIAQELPSSVAQQQLAYYNEGVITHMELAMWIHQEFHRIMIDNKV